ncbi:hypothetical protein Hrd1104_02865 [Halorhabdus sp. CBA1104]|uniref:VanZ family protein n=1 Tax=unclassified Halorhabdus TaxID=2621901 RepID=UPI0012B1C87D|nr:MULTISPECIES: VanZ family protein [unclassified Halorhabdus]QGN06338.1 hypothetical protein Hrd1104_02865 [Halorhabdus sp. CBA1104]
MAHVSRRVPRTIRWLLAIVVATAIVLGSVVDPGAGIARSGPLGLTWARWSHLGGYGFLTLTVYYALLASPLKTAVSAATVPIAVSGFGAVIELLQATLPYRTFAIGDILTNAAGAVLVAVVWSLGRRWLGDLESRRW